MVEHLQLHDATITYNALGYIKEEFSLHDQLEHLTEDLLQIEINESFLVDVGYYPECSPEGRFKIVVIKDYDWTQPVWVRTCKEILLLVPLIQEVLDEAQLQIE